MVDNVEQMTWYTLLLICGEKLAANLLAAANFLNWLITILNDGRSRTQWLVIDEAELNYIHDRFLPKKMNLMCHVISCLKTELLLLFALNWDCIFSCRKIYT